MLKSALSTLTQGRDWLDEHGWNARMYLRPHTDALAAGALLAQRVGSEVAFTDPSRHPPEVSGPLVVVDFGAAPVSTRAPVLYVDRRAGDVDREGGDVVVGDERLPSTSALAWRLTASQSSRAWLADLGTLSSRGSTALHESGCSVQEIEQLRRVQALCVAAERLHNGPALTAFRMLHAAESPQEALSRPEARYLVRALGELARMSRSIRELEPRVTPAGGLVEFDAPAELQSQVARTWARRLADRPVIACNRGWRHDRVAFAMASLNPRRLELWLAGLSKLTVRQLDLGELSAHFASGSMSHTNYERFVAGWDRAPAVPALS